MSAVMEIRRGWGVCSQWVSAGVLTLEAQGRATPAQRSRLDALMAQDRGRLTADILHGHPDIVLIDRQSFDWLTWAEADATLSSALNAYQPVRTVGGIAIWARKDLAPH